MKKQPERTAKTKQALIDSFWELYCTKKIDKITIKEVSDGAGLYRSTFYEYFGSIYDVLEHIEDELIRSYKEMIRILPLDSGIASILKLVQEFYEENIEHVSVLIGPNGDKDFTEKLKRTLIPVIIDKTGLDDAGENSVEVDILFEVFFSTAISILNYWYSHKDELSINEVMKIGSTILKNGLLPYIQSLGFKFDM